MVAYEDETVFPAPKDAVWKLLLAHLDDAAIRQIHPQIVGQKTVSQDGTTTIVDRTIDVRGKQMTSRWKVTYRSPDSARWDIQSSEGPWATGSFLENTYSDAPGGTLIRSRGELKVSVLPFFIPQKGVIRKAFETIHSEDVAALAR
jgi:hypothetical protein